MEYRTLKNEIELLESIQRLMNEVNTELDFNDNYMTMLELFSTMKRLKSYNLNGFSRSLELLH